VFLDAGQLLLTSVLFRRRLKTSTNSEKELAG
jgi:hypothetical protein